MDLAPDRLTAGTQIGDYLLTELLYDGPTTRSWLAKQTSINREVIIDSLNWVQQQDENYSSTFLGDVRAKAAIDHPLIGSVFEAVKDQRHCFYAREKLTGTPLQELLEQGSHLSPYSVAHILRQLAELNLYLEENGTATLPIQPEQIFISEHSLCRVANMAVCGARELTTATADKHCIAEALIPLLESGQPGSTRTRSLLDFMRDLEREIPLTWEQIRELSESIELHISTPTEPIPKNAISQRLQRNGIAKKIAKPFALIAAGALVVFGVSTFISQPQKAKAKELGAMVRIPAGSYTSHDGDVKELNAFWIDSHEVTIAEYAEFLKATKILTAEQISAYQHPQQPAEKVNHQPTDWENLLAAANNNTMWNAQKVDPNCPIVGVDWWDAFTYCSYKRGQLPSARQWHAALRDSFTSNTDTQTLSASAWGPVDQPSNDITSSQIYGLAGNVSEWSSSMSKDPSSPTKPKMPMILGGSYLHPHSGATKREWLNGDSRSTRRPDLGFRLVSKHAPSE